MCAKSYFISLNQKTSVMPNLGITLVFLVLANYQLLFHALFGIEQLGKASILQPRTNQAVKGKVANYHSSRVSENVGNVHGTLDVNDHVQN
jgi:hypothetical protein